MILPRIATFKSARGPHSKPTTIRFTHIVMVDGDTLRGVCNRQPLTNGTVVPPTEILCNSCRNRGWINTLGSISNTPIPRTYNGRVHEEAQV
jgi:hypothetical protein